MQMCDSNKHLSAVCDRFGFKTDEQNGAKTANVYSEVSPSTASITSALHTRKEPTRPNSVSGWQKGRSSNCRYWQHEEHHRPEAATRPASTVLTPVD